MERKSIVFSKAAALSVFFAVSAFAMGLLTFVYFQGGLSHAVHQ